MGRRCDLPEVTQGIVAKLSLALEAGGSITPCGDVPAGCGPAPR